MNQIAALLERTVVMDDNSIGISYSPTNRRIPRKFVSLEFSRFGFEDSQTHVIIPRK
jgi:hypothetical protein